MQIQHEKVVTFPRLPFKYYEHKDSIINVESHWHEGIEINYLISGDKLSFVTNGNVQEYYPGDIWTVNKAVIHSATGPKDSNWLEIGLVIDYSFLVNYLPSSETWNLTLNGQKTANKDSYEIIKNNLLKIKELLSEPVNDITILKILSSFYLVIIELSTNFNEANTSSSKKINSNLILVNNVIKFISLNYYKNIDENSITEKFKTSKTTLNDQFKINVQMSVSQYLRLVRLLNASEMLLKTTYSIDYVAINCGFSSLKTFNRNFRDWKGLTPSQYRKNNQI